MQKAVTRLGRVATMGLRVVSTTLALVLFSGNSAAVDRYHSSTLKWVYPQANGDFLLGFDINSPYCNGYGETTKYMYVVVGQNGMTADGAKRIYAAALLGFATGKRLDIGFDDATVQCYINRVTVTN